MIPLWIFLLAWLALMAIYAIMSLISVTQMLRYGISSSMTAFSTMAFLACLVLVIGGTSIYFLRVDWSQTLNLFSGLTSSASLNLTP